MITYNSNLKIFHSTLINDEHFISGFCSKAAGDARKTSDIINFFSTNYELVKNPLIILDQIHSSNVAIFSKKNPQNIEELKECDGVVSIQKQVIFTVQTADCAPIIFADKKTGVVGISHQGWRGSLKRLPQKMIHEMLKLGAKNETITAAIGPSIGQCCYHIDEDRYHDFLDEFDKFKNIIFQPRGGRYFLDLSRLDYLLLLECGLDKSNIDFFPFCTACDTQRFFSFRRDGKKNYGEMLSFIATL